MIRVQSKENPDAGRPPHHWLMNSRTSWHSVLWLVCREDEHTTANQLREQCTCNTSASYQSFCFCFYFLISKLRMWIRQSGLDGWMDGWVSLWRSDSLWWPWGSGSSPLCWLRLSSDPPCSSGPGNLNTHIWSRLIIGTLHNYYL